MDYFLDALVVFAYFSFVNMSPVLFGQHESKYVCKHESFYKHILTYLMIFPMFIIITTLCLQLVATYCFKRVVYPLYKDRVLRIITNPNSTLIPYHVKVDD